MGPLLRSGSSLPAIGQMKPESLETKLQREIF